MEVGRFSFHRRAFAAFNQLSPKDQKTVVARLHALSDVPVKDWDASKLKMPDMESSMYLLPVNSSLRIFVSAPAGSSSEVLDIVRKETLASFVPA